MTQELREGMLSQNALAKRLGVPPEMVRGMVGAYEGRGGRLPTVQSEGKPRTVIPPEALGIFERAWTLMYQANIPASEAMERVLQGERRLGLERLDEALGAVSSLRGVRDELTSFKTEAANLRSSLEAGRRVSLDKAPEILTAFEAVVKRGEVRRWGWPVGVGVFTLLVGLTVGYGWGQSRALEGYHQSVGELVGVFRGQDQRLKALENRVARALPKARR